MHLSIFLLFTLFSIPAWASAESRPNILLILADDMGYGDLAIQNPESEIPTPNLNQLAKEGMRFTDAHSPSSVCTPTRYSIMTGRYGWRSRLKKSVLWPWDRPLIEDDRLTIAQLLKDVGYDTALIGKWHLGWNWPTLNNQHLNRTDSGETVLFSKAIGGGPITKGFDYYFGDDVPNFPPYVFIENNRVTELPTKLKPESMFGINGVMADGWDLSSVMPMIQKKAIDFLKSRQKNPADKPFFLFVSLTAPHTPIAPTKEYRGKSKAGAYGDYVYQVDVTVGNILQALAESGQSNDTLVIFTSDNGSPARDGENMSGELGSVLAYGHDPSRPWRGIKGDAWEGGHRVPFIVRWPARVPNGHINSEIITLTDIMATVADIVDSNLPDDAAEDSLSLLPQLLNNKTRKKTNKKNREAIVLHSYEGFFAIRKGRWKLIQGYGGGGIAGKKKDPWFWEPEWQLYDLESDPAEKNNIISDHPEMVEKLSSLLKHYQASGRSVSTAR